MIVLSRSNRELPLAVSNAAWNSASASRNCGWLSTFARMPSSAALMRARRSGSTRRAASAAAAGSITRRKLDQIVEEFLADALGRVPGEHVRVEQVPRRARQDAGAGAAARGNQPLGGKHLEGFAHRLPADAELLGQFRFARQAGAFGVVAGDDAAADLVGQPGMQRARWIETFVGGKIKQML